MESWIPHRLCVISLIAFPYLVVGCGPAGDTTGDGGTRGDGGSGGIAGAGGTGATGGASGSGGTAGSAGTAGIGGGGGAGGVTDLCVGVDCADDNDCTIDGTCNPVTGNCDGAGNEPVDTPCGGGSQFCDGEGVCVECNRTEQCPDDVNECTMPLCDGSVCGFANSGGACDYFGGAGVCQNGICVDADLCEPYPCENRGACVDSTCNPANGSCSYSNRPIDTRCLGDGGRYCDGNGNCVYCNHNPQCGDGNECTTDVCDAVGINQCINYSVPNGSDCAGTGTACISGQCQADPLGRITYSGDKGDLTQGIWNWWLRANWANYGFYPYGLGGFYLNFTGSGVDHELDRIAVGFYQEDLSPLDPGLETGLWAVYHDKNADDAYNWSVYAQKLPVGSTQHQYGECNDGSGIWSKRIADFVHGRTPVLLGFALNRSTDHKVERIQVLIHEGSGYNIRVFLLDDSAIDPFCWSISYALVPSHRVLATETRAGSTKGSEEIILSENNPILQGFKMEFKNGDHNVDQVGARVLPGQLKVWLNDQNNDDTFAWQIWWADLK